MGLADVPRISKWFWNRPDAALFDRSLPVPLSVDALRDSWRHSFEQATSPSTLWFIAETQEDKPLGICGLEKVNYIQGDGVLPFFVAEQFRRRGLAQAMAVSMIDLAFNQLRLHRLTTYYRSDNVASEKILSKLRFTREGCIREGWYSDKGRKDIVIAGVLSSEWYADRQDILASVADTCALTFTPNCWNTARD